MVARRFMWCLDLPLYKSWPDSRLRMREKDREFSLSNKDWTTVRVPMRREELKEKVDDLRIEK